MAFFDLNYSFTLEGSATLRVQAGDLRQAQRAARRALDGLTVDLPGKLPSAVALKALSADFPPPDEEDHRPELIEVNGEAVD